MLLDQTEQLIIELNSFKFLQDSAQESQNFNKRNEDLKGILTYLESLSLIVLMFKKQGFIVDLKNILEYPFQVFMNLQKNWLADKTTIISLKDFFTKVNPSKIENEVKLLLKEQWQGFIEKNKPSINLEQLNVLEKIPDLSQVVSRLKVKLDLINELKKELPFQEKDFQLIISSSFEMNELLAQLSSNNIPDPVIHFLKKAGSYEGIELTEITPEILSWLNENNLTHLCQVRFRK
jgi:hypothetical protein